MNGYTAIFTKLTSARGWVKHAHKPMFIFAMPDGRYLVADARAAASLFADGHEDIR